MEMVEVRSSLFSRIGHEGDTLRVVYKRGETYDFGEVSPAEFEAFRSAESLNNHFNEFIRGRKPCKRMSLATEHQSPQVAPKTVEAGETPLAVEAVKRDSLDLVESAKKIKVSDVSSDREAKEMLLAVRSQSKQIDRTFDPDIKRWHEGHKAALAMKAAFSGPIKEADAHLVGQINAYALAESRRIAEEQRRLQAEAKEKAEREAREEAERMALEDAIYLEAQGDTAAAEAVLDNPMPMAPRYVAPAPVAAQVADVKGISKAQVVLQIRIVDPSKVPDEYKVVDEAMILGVVRRTNGRVVPPGVEVYESAQTAVRTPR